MTSPNSPVSIDLPGLIALRNRLVGIPRTEIKTAASGDGPYRTRFRGRGMEFAEVRAYQPGDDVRSIDWRVTARRGKAHTKLFHEERERPVLLAIDYRRPMFFGTRGCFKAVQVSRLAALHAWQALDHGDRVGGLIFSEDHHVEVRPRSGKGAVLGLLRRMVQDPAWQRPLHRPFDPARDLAATLQRLHRVARPGSLILLLSDFTGWDPEVEKQLALLGRHCELTLVHCYDPLERELPPEGTYRVSDGAADLTIATDDPAAQLRYRAGFAARCLQVQDFARRYRCRHRELRTCDDPLDCLQPTPAGRR
ncbi:MAG: DUF58 domain-containing protein [Syntrophotaleaceae bacterium]